MTNKEMIANIAEETGLSQRAVKQVVDLVIEKVKSQIDLEDSFFLAGAGTFEKKTLSARVGTNPQTHEKIDIPAKITIRFRPAKAVKEALN